VHHYQPIGQSFHLFRAFLRDVLPGCHAFGFHNRDRFAQRYTGFSLTFSVLLVLALGLLFQPLRYFIERSVDRIFGKAKYEYIKALEEFGRQITLEKDAHASLSNISQKLTALVGARNGHLEFINFE